MKSWHRPHLDKVVYLDFKYIHGKDHVFELVLDMNNKKVRMRSLVDDGDYSKSWIEQDSRILVVLKKDRNADQFINTQEFNENCVSKNCKVFVCHTERAVHFFNNINWMIDEIKQKRYVMQNFEHYSLVPMFKEKHNIIENQIPAINEWRFVASESLLKRHLDKNKGIKNDTRNHGERKSRSGSKQVSISKHKAITQGVAQSHCAGNGSSN